MDPLRGMYRFIPNGRQSHPQVLFRRVGEMVGIDSLEIKINID